MILLASLLLLLALGAAERRSCARARAALPIRVHVNGTRGKSTVTRLIAGALRQAGIPTLAKVTGTEPRLILPDGSEQPVVRRASASIREQAWFMRRAARERVSAVVVECMAVRPELQWISEREMVHATIGVITNARLDHTDLMGRTREEIGNSLANTVPRGGVLVAGDEVLRDRLSDRCAALGTRLVSAGQVGQAGDDTSNRVTFAETATWLLANIATALAVTRELGVADEVALRGMRNASPDPGTLQQGTATIAGREVRWLDATAANDPDSLDLLMAESRSPAGPGVPRLSAEGSRARSIAVYNHRADRPLRLLAFAESSRVFRGSDAILLTGDRPPLSLVRRIRQLCPDVVVRFVAGRHLETAIEQAVSERAGDATIVCCGNTRGWRRPC